MHGVARIVKNIYQLWKRWAYGRCQTFWWFISNAFASNTSKDHRQPSWQQQWNSRYTDSTCHHTWLEIRMWTSMTAKRTGVLGESRRNGKIACNQKTTDTTCMLCAIIRWERNWKVRRQVDSSTFFVFRETLWRLVIIQQPVKTPTTINGTNLMTKKLVKYQPKIFRTTLLITRRTCCSTSAERLIIWSVQVRVPRLAITGCRK